MQAACRMACILLVLLQLAFVYVNLLGVPARADWMPSTGAEAALNFAEIIVLDDRVRVALEIDFADYPAFVPGDASAIPISSEAGPNPALSPSTGSTFQVLDADGSSIEPQIRTIDVRDRKPRPTAQSWARGSGSPSPPAGPQRSLRVIYAELDYPFTERPETLTFTPPLDDKGVASVGIGFLAHHGRVPVTDYRYLSAAETLRLDWDDPWYSAFANPNLSRHHRSALMSFISIEPREVRHEIIFRLRDLEEWVDLDLGDAETLTAAQIAAIEEKAGHYFEALDPLIIDGKEVTPSSVKAVVLEVGASGVTIVEDPKTIDRSSALMGVILSYPHRVLPKTLALTWQLFTEGAQKIPVSVADPAGAVPGGVTPEDPEVTWTNFLRTWQEPEVTPVAVRAGREIPIPALALLFFGLSVFFVVKAFRASSQRWRWVVPAVLTLLVAVVTVRAPVITVHSPGGSGKEAAKLISDAMLKNAATAMLETQPETFDVALESFVAEEEIGPVGAEMRRGLSVTLPSGARALTETIEDVKVEKVESSGDGVNVLARWTATVSGGHWGHLHRRKIHYRGLMDLEEMNRVWKLRGLTILSARPAA